MHDVSNLDNLDSKTATNTMTKELVIEVGVDDSTVCCRGADGALGHPAVYLTFSDQDTVQCYYCGCIYKRAKE